MWFHSNLQHADAKRNTAADVFVLNMDFTCTVDTDFQQDRGKSDYVHGWHVHITMVLSQSWLNNANRYIFKNTADEVEYVALHIMAEISYKQKSDNTIRYSFHVSSDHCCAWIVVNTKMPLYDVKHLIMPKV